MTFLVSEASCFLEGRDYSNETGGQTKRLSAVSGPGRRQAKPQRQEAKRSACLPCPAQAGGRLSHSLPERQTAVLMGAIII
ncbi:MAG: hypothetical protein JRI51_12840 [Deltaproteobacteria bacterium]|nr:hypothetical protein [Deltaproteobacteria bacterium]